MSLRQVRALETDGHVNHRLEMGMHVGTHMDMPMHMIEHGQYISELAPKRMLGRAQLLDVRGQDFIDRLPAGLRSDHTVVLVWTGWDQYFGSDCYFQQHPVLTDALAAQMVSAGIEMVIMDIPSPDRSPFAVHHRFFEQGIILVENAAGLGQLQGWESIMVLAVPMKIKADAAACRVLAWQEPPVR